jgi:hypothetical protein
VDREEARALNFGLKSDKKYFGGSHTHVERITLVVASVARLVVDHALAVVEDEGINTG